MSLLLKPAVLGCVIGLAITAAVIGGACTVNRKSDGLTCATQADCTGNRVCEAGYCVVDTAQCPAPCTSCDLEATPHICTVDVSGIPGDGINCPDGMQCDVTCHAHGSCGSVHCNGATSCTVTCIETNSCRDVVCGSGACTVDCQTTSACRNVTCTDSCACDVTCAQGDCQATSCPMIGSSYCTENGANNQPCMSAISGCSHC